MISLNQKHIREDDIMLDKIGINIMKNRRNSKFNVANSNVKQIPIKMITANPNQPRRIFGVENLKELSDSIKVYGVIQPITVRKLSNGNFELISGERRVRASIMAGLLRIPAIVVAVGNIDSALVALIENVQRCDLSFLEEATAYNRLLTEYGYTQEQLAIKLGKNQSTIANKVRLLKLPEAIRIMIAENHLTERHARALLRLGDSDMQMKVLTEILEKCLNVKQTDDLIDKILNGTTKQNNTVSQNVVPVIKDIRIFNNTVKKAVVMMKQNGVKTESREKEFPDRYEYHIKIFK